MPKPSLRTRLREFQAQMDQLLSWQTTSLSSRLWADRLNELRFVRATLAWEDFLEQTFICYLRGSRSILGQAYALKERASVSMGDAQAKAIGNNQLYGKWLNETWTLSRAGKFFSGPHPYQVLASPAFPVIRKIRNRIVHRSDIARTEFRNVVIAIYGAYRPGLTPGRFLTEKENGVARIMEYLHLLRVAGELIAS